MKRSSRQAASIQREQPAADPAAPADTAAAAVEAPKAAGMTWGWRVALFIWASAFVCLVAYELLTTLVRSLSRLF